LELRDLIVTPPLLMIVYVVAYIVRPYVTDNINRRYFFPALNVRIIGALAVGFIYQFYYKGGDTFVYHTHGSRQLWEAIMQSPINGFAAMFKNGEYGPGLWKLSQNIWYWKDPQSFFIIRIATVFDLFTFSSYCGTAVLFSVLSFVGGWMLFRTFYQIRPEAHFYIAISCLFMPSLVFWGSGILKDTVTLAFVGISTYCVYRMVFELRIRFLYVALLVLSLYIIYSVKIYILISLLIAFIVWISAGYFYKIKRTMLRVVLVPFLAIVCLITVYFTVNKVVEDNPRYALDKIAQTSMITAYDIRYGWGARTGEGSGYTLGELDGTWQSMLRLAPGAINVALFRPYLWEINNLLMLLSSLESLATLVFTLLVLLRLRVRLVKHLSHEVIFCLVFAIIFAFGVGISTFNFGTLSRYKIPLMPFYWTALFFIYTAWKKSRLNYSIA
jgi:hypothetical protein